MKLELHKLTFGFDKKNLVENLTYTFLPEKIHVITGKNGSGKTTLFEILAGFNSDYSGKINLVKDVEDDKKKNKKKSDKPDLSDISYMTQFYKDSFFFDSVKDELIETVKRTESKLNYDVISSYFDELGFNLSDFEHRSPFTLSTGEQKLLSLILSIIKNSSIILLDEVDSTFVYQTKIKLAEFIRNHFVNPEMVVIIISHDDEFIKRVSDVRIHFDGRGYEVC